MKERILKELSGAALPFTAFCVALNLSAGQIAAAIKLPIYLDSIGTVLAAVLIGPWAGCTVGVISNTLAAGFGNPTLIFFAPVMIVIASFSSFAARLGFFRTRTLCIIAGVLQGIVAAAAGAPVSAYVFGGTTLAGADAFVIFFRSVGNTILQSVFYQGLASDPVDKVISYLLVFSLIHRLPVRVLSRFPNGSRLIASGTHA